MLSLPFCLSQCLSVRSCSTPKGTNAWGHVDPEGGGPAAAGAADRPYGRVRRALFPLLCLTDAKACTGCATLFSLHACLPVCLPAWLQGECPTNGAPDVAGLWSVLEKLTTLPAAALPATYAASAAAWHRLAVL